MQNNKRESLQTQDVVNDGSQVSGIANASGVSKQRRKLIKVSAAAVPAIMTLRSGAVAAMASSYQCLTHPGADTTNIDTVLGDDPSDPSHDTWLRVDARPFYKLTNKSGTEILFHGLRKYNTTYEWDNVLGWDWYKIRDGVLKKTFSDPSEILAKKRLINRWVDSRVACYCVGESPQNWVFIDEYGEEPFVPTILNDYILRSKTLVGLLASYDQVSGELYYYPDKMAETGLPVAGSCWCSIDPTY